jgi:hypothetical protein
MHPYDVIHEKNGDEQRRSLQNRGIVACTYVREVL